MNIILSAAQLTQAQLGQPTTLANGETLHADRRGDLWRYTIAVDGVAIRVRYAAEGLEAAIWAINASQEEYESER